MTYLAVQALFAAVLYPLFLVLLSVVASCLTTSPKKIGRITGFAIFIISAILFFSCLNVNDSGVSYSIYLIASCVFMIFLGHYICLYRMPNAPYRGNLVYCLVLIFFPILSAILIYYNLMSLKYHAVQIFAVLALVDLLRWPLTLILAVWSTIKYKTHERFILILVGFLALALPILALLFS